MMIVKIGGGSAINIANIVADLARLDEPMVLVHGANALRNQLAESLGKPVQTITSLSGYTSVLSDENAIDLLMAAYAGIANTRLVAACQQQGINAVGLTGLDGRVVVGRRNRGVKTKVNGKKMLVRDFSGKPIEINTQLIHTLHQGGYTPVLCVPISDEDGVPINTENDSIVALLQHALNADRVFQLIEAPGLLRDVNDPNSVISRLDAAQLWDWEQRVEGRMRRKIMALRRLFEHGSATVHICDGRTQHPISDALSGAGTVIR